MDWTKAKSILIVALIVTNLILIVTYVAQNNQMQNKETEIKDVTIKLHAEKGIFVEADIPQEHPRMAKLTVQYDKMNEDEINQQLAIQKKMPTSELTDDKLISATTGFIEKCSLKTSNVTFDRIERSDGEIRVYYKNIFDNTPIEDSYIILTLKDGKITDLKRYWLNPVEEGDMEKEVIPAVAALIKFMSENKEEEEIHVKDISLVYWLDSSSFDAESPVTDTAFPAWKITYNDDKVKHIMAWGQ